MRDLRDMRVLPNSVLAHIMVPPGTDYCIPNLIVADKVFYRHEWKGNATLHATFLVRKHGTADAALRWAAQNGNASVLELLCARFGADVHTRDDIALREAAKNGHAAVVELLCARLGANVHTHDDAAVAMGGFERSRIRGGVAVRALRCECSRL